MTTQTTTPLPPVTAEQLLPRARPRYRQALDDELIVQIANAAAAAVNDRGDLDLHRRLIAAHVTVARLAGAHAVARDNRLRLTAEPVVGQVDPADLALAEHLHAALDEEEPLVT